MAIPLHSADPEWIGEYRLDARLGEGGQGTVYRAKARSGEPVAVKVLKEGLSDRRARQRFAREVRFLRRLGEKATVPIIDHNLHAERPYLVSGYVPGHSLDEQFHRYGPMNQAELISLAVRTMRALRVVHGEKIVHRDIKPKNILLGEDGRPWIIDFGIARAMSGTDTFTMGRIGTRDFMAPEQERGEYPLSDRADIYSWALTVLYAAGGYDPGSREKNLAEVEGPLRKMLQDCLLADAPDRPDADSVFRRMAAAGMTRAHGFHVEDVMASAMPATSAAPGDTLISPGPPWYLHPHVPYSGGVLVTAVCTGLVALLSDAGTAPLVFSAVGIFVLLLVQLSICTDPERSSWIMRSLGRPRTPRPPRRE